MDDFERRLFNALNGDDVAELFEVLDDGLDSLSGEEDRKAFIQAAGAAGAAAEKGDDLEFRRFTQMLVHLVCCQNTVEGQ